MWRGWAWWAMVTSWYVVSQAAPVHRYWCILHMILDGGRFILYGRAFLLATRRLRDAGDAALFATTDKRRLSWRRMPLLTLFYTAATTFLAHLLNGIGGQAAICSAGLFGVASGLLMMFRAHSGG